MAKKYTWYKIAGSENEIDWNPQDIALVEAGTKKICVARYQGKYFGFSPKCPHAGGMLTDAWLDSAGNLVCPLHRYKFNPQTGRNTSGEGYYLKTYPVEEREDGIYAGIEEGGIFSWL